MMKSKLTAALTRCVERDTCLLHLRGGDDAHTQTHSGKLLCELAREILQCAHRPLIGRSACDEHGINPATLTRGMSGRHGDAGTYI